MVAEVSIHGQLAPLLLDLWWGNSTGRIALWKKAVHLIADGKQSDSENESEKEGEKACASRLPPFFCFCSIQAPNASSRHPHSEQVSLLSLLSHMPIISGNMLMDTLKTVLY